MSTHEHHFVPRRAGLSHGQPAFILTCQCGVTERQAREAGRLGGAGMTADETVDVDLTEVVNYSRRFTVAELAEDYGCEPAREAVVAALFADRFERVLDDVRAGQDTMTMSDWNVR